MQRKRSSIGWLAYGWLLSVGGHYTNATKQTQAVELLIILACSYQLGYLDSNFLFLYMF